MILSIKTDQQIAELGLYEADGVERERHQWQAHLKLAETLHQELLSVLRRNTLKLEDLTGIVVFRGPGSYTGLRIGLSVANALAASLQIPLAGESGENWLQEGLIKLKKTKKPPIITPIYGGNLYVTPPSKN